MLAAQQRTTNNNGTNQSGSSKNQSVPPAPPLPAQTICTECAECSECAAKQEHDEGKSLMCSQFLHNCNCKSKLFSVRQMFIKNERMALWYFNKNITLFRHHKSHREFICQHIYVERYEESEREKRWGKIIQRMTRWHSGGKLQTRQFYFYAINNGWKCLPLSVDISLHAITFAHPPIRTSRSHTTIYEESLKHTILD